MADINEIAISYWRIDKWLKNTNVERKMAVTSSLRSIKKFLDNNNVEVLDLTGNKYDAGLAVEVIGRDYEDETPDESKLVISEMLKPVIMQNGSVMQFGQVTIGYKVKEVKPNKELAKNEDTQNKETVDIQTVKEIADNIEKQIKNQTKGVILRNVLAVVILGVIIALLIANLLATRNFQINMKVPSGEEQVVVLPVASTDSEKSDVVYFFKYTIQEGETLESIFKSNNIEYTQSNINYIKGINGIDDVNSIYAGYEILLPKEEN